MLPALAARSSPTATGPTTNPPRARSPAPADRCPAQVAANVMTKMTNKPGRQPQRPRHQVEDQERAAMRIERVERTHERIVGENRRILVVQEQRQPIGLVAVEAVISAQAQVKTQDDDIDQPPTSRKPCPG